MNMKIFTSKIDENLQKEARILGIKQKRTFQELIDEAIRDLLLKYEEEDNDDSNM